MDDQLQCKILDVWNSRIGASSISAPPATESELQIFEAEFGSIPTEFRWFLASCGGGPVGSEWVDNIYELTATHRKFRSEFGGTRAWTLTETFIIGWDGYGNPFGIHTSSGRLLVEDHTFGGIHEKAPSFASFLAKGLSLNNA